VILWVCLLGGIAVGAACGNLLGKLCLPTVEQMENADWHLKSINKAQLKYNIDLLQCTVYSGLLGGLLTMITFFMYRAWK